MSTNGVNVFKSKFSFLIKCLRTTSKTGLVYSFYRFKKIFNKSWDPKPNIVLWVYKIIVRLILTHGILVWCKTLGKQNYFGIFKTFQKMAGIYVYIAVHTITFTLRSVYLNTHPLDLFINEVVVEIWLKKKKINLNNYSFFLFIFLIWTTF